MNHVESWKKIKNIKIKLNRRKKLQQERDKITKPAVFNNLSHFGIIKKNSELVILNNTEESNGWGNLIVLVAFMGVFRFILINFVELGWLVEIPCSKFILEEYIWFFVFILLNISRLFLFYLISRFKIPTFSFIF